jgi:quinol monooxygenase YgiN
MAIDIIVDIDLTDNQLPGMLGAFRELAARTLEEEGCHRFDVYLVEDRDDAVVLVERWADQEAIDLHMKMPYTEDFLRTVQDAKAFASPPRARRVRSVNA